MLAAAGRHATRGVLFFAELSWLIVQAFRDLLALDSRKARAVARVYLKQVYFTGLEALAVIATLFLLIGVVVIAQIIGLAGIGSAGLTGKVLVWIVIRELGPLLTAVIVIARSGTAIAAELASMKINGELDTLESLGVPAAQYLIMPRIFGATTAFLVLTLYAEVVSIVGGFLTASLVWNISLEQFSQGILPLLTPKQIGVSFLKSFFFGLFVAAACCRQGLGVGESATQIPQAATKGVMQSLFLVFFLDVVIMAATLS